MSGGCSWTGKKCKDEVRLGAKLLPLEDFTELGLAIFTLTSHQGGLQMASEAGTFLCGALDVVSWKGTEDARPLARADEPAVVAHLHDVEEVALRQLDLVVVVGLVVVQRSVPVDCSEIRARNGKVALSYDIQSFSY